MSTFINVNVDLQGILDRLKDQQQAQRQAQLEKEKNQTFEEQIAEATRQFEQQQLRSFAATPANSQKGRPLRQDELSAFRRNRCPVNNAVWTVDGKRVLIEPRGTIPLDGEEAVAVRLCFRYLKYRVFSLVPPYEYGEEIEIWDGTGTGDPNDPDSDVGPPGSEPFSGGIYTNPLYNFGYNIFGTVLVKNLNTALSGSLVHYDNTETFRVDEGPFTITFGGGISFEQIGPYRIYLGSSQFYTLDPLGSGSNLRRTYAITSYNPIIAEFLPVNSEAPATPATCYFGANPFTIPT